MLTVTSLPGADWPHVMRAWSHLVRQIRKVAPATQYAVIKEVGPDTGMLHLHAILLFSKYLPQSDLSNWWEHYSGASIVDIRGITSAGSIRYLAKHITKQVDQLRNPVTYSRTFPVEEFEQTLELICRMPRIPDDFTLTHVHGWGMLLGQLAPDCTCFKQLTDIEPEERLWLASHSHPSWPP
ncbi:hypothetical protein ES703_41131 [subsurface metagenome]